MSTLVEKLEALAKEWEDSLHGMASEDAALALRPIETQGLLGMEGAVMAKDATLAPRKAGEG